MFTVFAVINDAMKNSFCILYYCVLYGPKKLLPILLIVHFKFTLTSLKISVTVISFLICQCSRNLEENTTEIVPKERLTSGRLRLQV